MLICGFICGFALTPLFVSKKRIEELREAFKRGEYRGVEPDVKELEKPSFGVTGYIILGIVLAMLLGLVLSMTQNFNTFIDIFKPGVIVKAVVRQETEIYVEWFGRIETSRSKAIVDVYPVCMSRNCKVILTNAQHKMHEDIICKNIDRLLLGIPVTEHLGTHSEVPFSAFGVYVETTVHTYLELYPMEVITPVKSYIVKYLCLFMATITISTIIAGIGASAIQQRYEIL